MGEDAVADLGCEVQSLRDPVRLFVVTEPATEALAQAAIELILARMPERRVTHVVAEANRLRQVLVQTQRASHDACDAARLERVGHPRAVVVAGGVDEHLSLALEPPERLRVEDAVAVALKRRSQSALRLIAQPACGVVGMHGERRERVVLLLPDACLESSCDSSGQIGHNLRVSASPVAHRPTRGWSRR